MRTAPISDGNPGPGPSIAQAGRDRESVCVELLASVGEADADALVLEARAIRASSGLPAAVLAVVLGRRDAIRFEVIDRITDGEGINGGDEAGVPSALVDAEAAEDCRVWIVGYDGTLRNEAVECADAWDSFGRPPLASAAVVSIPILPFAGDD